MHTQSQQSWITWDSVAMLIKLLHVNRREQLIRTWWWGSGSWDKKILNYWSCSIKVYLRHKNPLLRGIAFWNHLQYYSCKKNISGHPILTQILNTPLTWFLWVWECIHLAIIWLCASVSYYLWWSGLADYRINITADHQTEFEASWHLLLRTTW